MDPSTVQQQPIPGNELALEINMATRKSASLSPPGLVDGLGHVLRTSACRCWSPTPNARKDPELRAPGDHDQVSIILVRLSSCEDPRSVKGSASGWHLPYDAQGSVWNIQGLWGVSLLNSRALPETCTRSTTTGTSGVYLAPRKHSEEKQKEFRKQVDALLKLGVIKETKATEWCQVHLVPEPTPEPKVAIHSRLRSIKLCHGWSRRIAYTQYTANHQQDWYSETQGVWNYRLHCRISPDISPPGFARIHGLHYSIWSLWMDSSSYGSQRLRSFLPTYCSMSNKVLTGYVTRICEIYIDDVLVYGATDDEYVDNLRKVLVRLRA
jgi:hypothetical protein